MFLAAVATRRKSQTVPYMCPVTERCSASTQLCLEVLLWALVLKGSRGPW
jgi:hypothetical protein